jgi:thiamine-phosphate pyrophosphorylase
MAHCYSGSMVKRHALPEIWLISDARNDARLESVLLHLPRRSGLVFRHYHLDGVERRKRYDALARIARTRGHLVVLAGTAREARRWGAVGAYGEVGRLAGGPALLRLATAHSLREIGRAQRIRADAILLSPVFATRSHPGADTLGPTRFRLLARHALLPVIALGGISRRRAKTLAWKNWAAIDGI